MWVSNPYKKDLGGNRIFGLKNNYFFDSIVMVLPI